MSREAAAATPPPCPEHGPTMQLRRGRSGEFWGCREYPACRQTVPVGLPGIVCPTCAGPIVERVAKKSERPFWPCANRACEFVAWVRPHLCSHGGACFAPERERSRPEPDAVPDPAIPEQVDSEVPF